MQRLLTNICQESKNENIQIKCTRVLDGGKEQCTEKQLECVLDIFQWCACSDVRKLNALGVDLVRLHIRRVNENCTDGAKEETISTVLKCCRDILTDNPSGSTHCTLELSTIIVEIVATFAGQLTIKHVIDIIEMCHAQIKDYVVSVNSRSAAANASLPAKANSLLSGGLASLVTRPSVSIDDKVLAAISLTGGQVCHYYTKYRIVGGATHLPSETGGGVGGSSATHKVSQDFFYLLLYLSKKLESKLSFYREIRCSGSTVSDSSEVDQSKAELFVLIKIYNCFYLKCLQYTLLTVPDAWKCMTTHLMEIVCKHLVPILVDILTPLSTILVNQHSVHYRQVSNAGKGAIKGVKDLSTFGRGSEKVGSANSNNKDFLYNTLNYQERQYIYKISLELLRLFGLENSMRPLLEALYHRILLLPPLDQRLDSLIYMQDILKNPLLVLILMSNPMCLFGASSSHSQNLDLFKIFIDAIKEASHSDDTILVQLSSLCLATLLSTLDTLANRSVTTVASDLDTLDTSVWKSPTVKTIVSYANIHRNQYEQPIGGGGQSGRAKSYSVKYHSLASRSNILNLKSRICGFDSIAFEKNRAQVGSTSVGQSITSQVATAEVVKPTQHSTELESDEVRNRPYMREDFNYQDRLRALMGNSVDVMSSVDSGEECHSRTVELEDRSAAPAVNDTRFLSKAVNRLPSELRRHRSLSLSDLTGPRCTTHQDWLMTSLKYTNSDSHLYLKDPLLVMDRAALDRVLSYDSADSVFEAEFSNTDHSSVATESENGNDLVEDDYLDDEVGCRGRGPKEPMRMRNSIASARNMFLEHDEDASLRHFERSLSHIFIRKLRALLPELLAHRQLVMVDEIVQRFASDYCKDLFRNLKQLNRVNQGTTKISVSALTDLTQDEIDTLAQYCHLVEALFINADGIYLATYSALLLNMKLLYLNYYHWPYEDRPRPRVPLSENGFIDEIFNYHITVYLSSHFLAEIYQCILANNFFESVVDAEGTRVAHFETIPLIKLLHDIDILDLNKPNAFKLCEYVRLEQMGRSNPKSVVNGGESSHYRPLAIIVKRFLAHFWDPLLGCVRVGLECRSFTFQAVVHMLDTVNCAYIGSLYSVLHCDTKQTFAQMQSGSAYIQMMQSLLDTSIRVGCFARLDTVYALFHAYIARQSHPIRSSGHLFISEIKANLSMRKSITSPDLASKTSTSTLTSSITSTSSERPHPTLSAGQIISMKTLLNRSSEIASHCPRVWRHVFDLCRFVTDLENAIFRSCHSSLLSRARISIGTILRSNSISNRSTASGSVNSAVSSADANDHYQNLYSYTQFNTLPGISELESANIETSFDSLLVAMRNKNRDLELKSKEMEQVIEYLSWFVGQIFENVAFKFNLSLLNSFVRELCAYSAAQLADIKPPATPDDTRSMMSSNTTAFDQSSDPKSLMLFRLVEVILRFVRNGRPLLHFMKIWPVAAAHLVDASTHRDLTISKKAITSMHDIINAVLSAYSEPDFFNFNESLFKSYERLLLFELCNSDCQQELLLNSICEFVEGAAGEIRSGWRSIFKALRGLRLAIRDGQLTVNCSHHIQIVVDTFEAYLHTNNMHVFAYASVDFILCIFHLLRGVCSYPTSVDKPTPENNLDLEETFIIFLKYVQKFCKQLRSIQSMPEDAFVISPLIRAKKIKYIQLDRLRDSMARIDPSERSYNLTLVDQSDRTETDKMLNSSLLQLWLLVFDEYATTVQAANLLYRPMLLEVYFTLIQTAAELNGSLHFVLHCFNHIIVPLIQNLLAETVGCMTSPQLIEEQYMFLKSWLEVFNNYIVKYITAQYDRSTKSGECTGLDTESLVPVALLFRQTLLVYIECLTGHFHDLISVLALSLLRHLLLSLNRMLTAPFWQIVVDCFCIGHQLTLSPLRQLMVCFTGLPVSADLARIKIMTTRTDRVSEYTRKRARQIFFMATGGNHNKNSHSSSPAYHQTRNEPPVTPSDHGGQSMDNRDYNIIVETSAGINQSLSYNLLISQLHSHLVLLQIIASVMTFNLKPALSNLMFFVHEDFHEMCNADQSLSSQRPVMKLTLTQYRDLCVALKQSFGLAMEFDSRPGLKFLMQHICQTNISANLYQMSALVWCVQFVVNFALCCSATHRNEDCLAVLEELFAEATALYGQKVQFVQETHSLSPRNSDSNEILPEVNEDYEEEEHGEQEETEPAIEQRQNSGDKRPSMLRRRSWPGRHRLPFVLQPLSTEHDLLHSEHYGTDGTQMDSAQHKPNPFNSNNIDDTTKVYRLVTNDLMAQVLSEYRRMKHRQSSGRTVSQSKRSQSNAHSQCNSANGTADLGLDHDTRRFLSHDSTICVRIWSDILSNCIDLHRVASHDSFTFTLSQFRVLVRQLLLTATDDTLRRSLAAWVDHLALEVVAAESPQSPTASLPPL